MTLKPVSLIEPDQTTRPRRRFHRAFAILVALSCGTAFASLADDLKNLRTQPETAERFAAEAKLLHYLAEVEKDGSARERFHTEGLDAATKALALDDRNPAAILWWTAHRGSQATPLNPFQAIKIAREVEKSMVKLRIVAADHEHGAADRVLGKLYLVAPPAISVGSKEKAKKHLQEALKIAPDYPGNRLIWAEYLVWADDCTEARKIADDISKADLSAWPLDAPLWKRDADVLMDKTRGCR